MSAPLAASHTAASHFERESTTPPDFEPLAAAWLASTEGLFRRKDLHVSRHAKFALNPHFRPTTHSQAPSCERLPTGAGYQEPSAIDHVFSCIFVKFDVHSQIVELSSLVSLPCSSSSMLKFSFTPRRLHVFSYSIIVIIILLNRCVLFTYFFELFVCFCCLFSILLN